MMNSSAFGECSKPKKSKPCQGAEFSLALDWAHLPALVLHDIFDLLNTEDRKNASAVCRHWRQNSFHHKWWPSMKFKIEQDNLEKAKFYAYTFGKLVSEAVVVLSSLSPVCVEEFIVLLRLFRENNHLKCLLLQPSHCRLETNKRIECSQGDSISEIMNELIPILPRLENFDIGCLEDLSKHLVDILTNLTPSKVTSLGLASIKDDPSNYESCCFDPDLIVKFVNLQLLSIDYDQLSDLFLSKLDGATSLTRLVVHLHRVPPDHPGTSNEAWREFKRVHPNCELRLTVIHAYEDIVYLHKDILLKEMPLSHLKVYFCESVNVDLLHLLSTYYPLSLRSLVWVDSLSERKHSWALSQSFDVNSPDPLVLAAWLCPHLEELVLIGYKYLEENLVALGRLRGSRLKRLEIPYDDILYDKMMGQWSLGLTDIQNNLGRPWSPLKHSELHPVIQDPLSGDSDEFLLPIVLADLY